MSIDDKEYGRFESLVLARLDALKDMAADVRECQKELKQGQRDLDKRITRLEHQETRLVAIATILSTIITCAVGVGLKLLLK